MTSTEALFSDQRVPLEEWCAMGNVSFPDLTFAVCCTSLVCSPQYLLVSRARLLVSSTGEYEMQVLLKKTSEGELKTIDDLFEICKHLSCSSPYKFCPGLSKKQYEKVYGDIIRYDSKSVQITSEPFSRVDSPRCDPWHNLARNASILEKDPVEVLCQPCKKMVSYLDQRVRAAATSAQKVARQEPSSRCPISVLSPAGRKKRKENLMKKRAHDKKIVRKYEHTEITLDDEQSDEMAEIVDIINRDSSACSTLKQIFSEAQEKTKESNVKQIWKSDVRKQFENDHASNGKLYKSSKGEWLIISPPPPPPPHPLLPLTTK